MTKVTRIWLVLLIFLVWLAPCPAPRASAAGHAGDAWWDGGWPYRIRVDAGGPGIVDAAVDFSAAFDSLGLNHALLDLRSLRVVAYNDTTPIGPLPHAETYSTLLEDAESPQIGWSAGGVWWKVNDGSAQADTGRSSQGSGSLKAVVDNQPGGYGYPGVELLISSSDPLSDWSDYEVLVYDVWPQVNASALDQAPDLYWFKLYNACAGSSVTQGGPPLALDQWNGASVSLHPLDNCWPADGLDLSDITRLEFHTRDNATVNGNSGLWDDGDRLTLWFDNLRLVDQDSGTLRWQTTQAATHYYVYFDTLAHEGHPNPSLDHVLGAATASGSLGSPEAGGYYHQVDSATGLGSLQVWTAPTVEKILTTMAYPTASAPLRISAARGEFEPFQLVVRSPVTQDVAISASTFTLTTGTTRGQRQPVGGLSVTTLPAPTIHRVDYVNITSAGDHYDRYGLWPDPLWPLDAGDTVPLSAGTNQPLWVTLHVPWNAAPGMYQGQVQVGAATIPVELQVWDFALPRETHLMSEWGFAWSRIVEDVYQGYGDWPCYWDMVEAFKQDFANHRLIPKGVAWPAGLNYPGGVEYDCDGGLDPDAWGDWDFATIAAKYVHGEDGFNDGYGFPAFLALGPKSNWPPNSLPSSFCGETREGVLGTDTFQSEWTQYLSAVDGYVSSDDYASRAYYHIVNEPQTTDDYEIVGQISALTESAAPHLRQLVSEQVEPAIFNYPGAKIDVWMPTITNYEPVKSHDRQKNHNEDVWWYYLYGDDPPLPNPILMGHPGIEARITPWLAWVERVDGLLHYDTTDWSPNPWLTPNVTGKDNGDGYFFYPPRKDGSSLDHCGQNGHRLVPSIRWENMRDGMEDYEYLWLMLGAGPTVGQPNQADSYVAQIVQSRTLFSRVPSALLAARQDIAQVLAGPQATKSVHPAGTTPGAQLTYSLVYTHKGPGSMLVATDTVPSLTPVLTATGPGTVTVQAQQVRWQVPVVAGQSVTLSIQARAAGTPGKATNTAAFSSSQVLTASTTVTVFQGRRFLPIILRLRQ